MLLLLPKWLRDTPELHVIMWSWLINFRSVSALAEINFSLQRGNGRCVKTQDFLTDLIVVPVSSSNYVTSLLLDQHFHHFPGFLQDFVILFKSLETDGIKSFFALVEHRKYSNTPVEKWFSFGKLSPGGTTTVSYLTSILSFKNVFLLNVFLRNLHSSLVSPCPSVWHPNNYYLTLLHFLQSKRLTPVNLAWVCAQLYWLDGR